MKLVRAWLIALVGCHAPAAPVPIGKGPPALEIAPMPAIDAGAPARAAPPTATRTREGFVRSQGTLTKISRHVNVIELPPVRCRSTSCSRAPLPPP